LSIRVSGDRSMRFSLDLSGSMFRFWKSIEFLTNRNAKTADQHHLIHIRFRYLGTHKMKLSLECRPYVSTSNPGLGRTPDTTPDGVIRALCRPSTYVIQAFQRPEGPIRGSRSGSEVSRAHYLGPRGESSRGVELLPWRMPSSRCFGTEIRDRKKKLEQIKHIGIAGQRNV
jgi:hypothetical protein